MGRTFTAMAKALSFTHLAQGVTRAADDDSDGDGDAQKGRAKRAADDDKPDPDDDAKKGQRAADDGKDKDDNGDNKDAGDGDTEDSDDKDDSGKGKHGRKAKRARAQDDEGDGSDDDVDKDDKDEEMRGESQAAAARRREQARCAAIFASKAAGRNPVLAANLAFCTRLPRSEALAMLEGSPPAPGSFGLAGDRAARNPRVGPSNSVQMDSRKAIAASWDHAFAKVNPRSR